MNKNNKWLWCSGAVLSLALSGNAFAQDPVCNPFEKQVSVDGGTTWHDADDPASAPTRIAGVGVVYRFVVKNCEANKTCFDTRVSDPTLGIAEHLVGDGTLIAGEEQIVTHNDKGFANLNQPKQCFPSNEATEKTRTDGHSEDEVFSDFAYVNCEAPKKARLGDRVWEDLNGDGEQDDGEPGIPGVQVDLYDPGEDGLCSTNDAGENLLATTNTNGTGFYLFDELDAGDYCVEFPAPENALMCEVDQQASYTTKNAIGIDVADDSNANPDGSTDVVGLAAGDEDLTIDAGLFCSVSLGDTLWNDTNRDGVQDDLNMPGGEQGVNGVTVTLLDCDSEPVGSSTTTGPAPVGVVPPQVDGGAGWYQFANLVPGCYSVKFDKPTGFVFSDADQAGEDLDSDVNANGVTNPVTLNSGDSDQTVDAGINKPVAGLGDFVFEDTNANGIQDDGENGIPDVPVTLLRPGPDGDCNTNDDEGTGLSTTTDADGKYAFNDLDEGVYCVSFDKSGVNCTTGDFILGDAQFSPALQGDDQEDSNPDPETGVSGNINLPADTFDPSIDAGIYCPAKLGNRVWEDTNENGLQDDGEPGIENVMVKLFECGDDMQTGGTDDVDTLEKRTTVGEEGMYMFGGELDYALKPGKYFVQFMDPEGRELTTSDQSPGDLNSDCKKVLDGKTSCVTLGSGEVNLDVDCGLLPPPPPACELNINKSCRVEVAPPPPGEGSCKGRIQEFSMIWNGADGVNLAGVGPLSTNVSTVNKGDTVTFINNNSGSNDVFVDLSDLNGDAIGQSKFHLSCSDDDMDADTDTNDAQVQVSPLGQDCGKNQGNGKDNDDDGFVNDWLLDGIVDAEGKLFQCTPPEPAGFSENCSFESSSVSCDTHGKPSTITLRYAGSGPVSDCLDNSASRADEKPPTCSGNLPAGATVEISIDDGSVSKTTVAPGETFEITDYSSQTEITLVGGGGTEFVSFHTSCSAPLETGDIYGNLELVGLDGQRSTATVSYQYEVTNLGDPLTDVMVSDNLLGAIGEIGVLDTGDSKKLTAVTELSETTTNVGSATGTLDNGTSCPATPDSVKVTAVEPTCRVTLKLDEIKDDELKFELKNTGPITATLKNLTLNFPADFESIKKVELDGDIFKEDDSDTYPDGVSSGTTITEADWTKEDVSKRQLEVDEKRTLKFRFSEKYKDAVLNDFSGSINFAEDCSLVIE